MYAMNVSNDLMVPYASALIMEIYKDGDEYFADVSVSAVMQSCSIVLHRVNLFVLTEAVRISSLK